MLKFLEKIAPVRSTVTTTDTTSNGASRGFIEHEDEKNDNGGFRPSNLSDKDVIKRDGKIYAESSNSAGEEAATAADPSLNPGGLSFEEGKRLKPFYFSK